MNLNLSYSRTSHLCGPIKFLMASLSDVVVDLMPRTDLIFSILDLSRSVSGAINSSEIIPAESITKAAKICSSNLFDNAFGQEINDSYKLPLISTVGDFNHTTGKLITGHNPIEYNASNIPGLQINDCPPQKEIAIYINGFLVNGKSLGSENATEIFDRARLSLNNTGYDVTLIGFNWDADIKNDKAWEVTKDVAKSNGLKLAQFILDFKKVCPQTDVRLIAHSLGSRIVLSSLDALHENQEWNNNNFTIASVHLLGAAVDSSGPGTVPLNVIILYSMPPGCNRLSFLILYTQRHCFSLRFIIERFCT